MSIRSKISNGFLLVALTLSLLLTGGAYWIAHKTNEKLVTDHLSSVVSIQKHRVEQFLAWNRERVALVASRTQLRLTLDKYLKAPRQQYLDKMHRILKDALNSVRDFKSVSLVNLQGKVVASTEPDKIGRQFRFSNFRQSGSGDNPATQKLNLNEKQQLSIELLGPLLLDDKLLGRVWIEMDGGELVNIISDYTGLGETGETVLGESLEEGVRLFTPTRFRMEKSRPPIIPYHNQPLPMLYALQGKKQLLHAMTDYRGHEVYAVSDYLKGVDWGIVAKIDRDEVYGQLFGLGKQMLILIVASIPFILLMAYVLSRNISRPISALTAVAEKISSGDFHQQADELSNDETGILAKAFNRMTRELFRGNAELQAREVRTNAILETVSDAIVVTDEQGIIQTFNTSAEHIFGYAHQEMIGHSVNRLMPEPYRSEHDGYMRRFSETGIRHVIGLTRELPAVRKNGSEFLVELSLDETQIEDKHIYVGVMRDVTQRKQAEKILYEAKLAAESASDAKSEFLANISHELRTPLNVIIGMSQLLLQMPLDEKQTTYVGDIFESGESLLAIVNDILEFTDIDQDNLKLNIREFHIEALLQDFKERLDNYPPNTNKRLKVKVDPAITDPLMGDRFRIGKVLDHLCSNAIKFSDADSEVVITIKIQENTPNDVLLRFSIQDEGIGIDQQHKDILFKPFKQIDGSNTRQIGGTGLGLAISKRVVELMEGKIWFDSEPGKGSVFHFQLRLDKANEAQQAATVSLPNSDSNRILVVEDDEMNRKMVSDFLSSNGYIVDLAKNGKKALTMINDTMYSAVLMDCQMPIMDGYTATREIRKLPGHEHLPIIALTAHATDGDREKALESGMTDYLTKPIKLDQLLEKLKIEAISQM